MSSQDDPPSRLERSLGLGGAVVVGVSAMIGTGVFAVWQPALERAGAWLIGAVVLAGIVAALNAVSTARLAARMPRAGGVYAYGRAYLGRPVGIIAGVVFIVGKIASASAAALTIGLYLWPANARLIAVLAVALVLALNLRGVVRSTRVAAVMVSIVIGVLILFTFIMSARFVDSPVVEQTPPVDGVVGLLAASAFVFVAFAGYARITVLGEEVRNPARVIPRAVAISFLIVVVLYVTIAVVVTSAAERGVVIGPAALSDIAEAVAGDWLVSLVDVAAVLAAGAVLLSLVAGVGRTLFAMADGKDAPAVFAAVGSSTKLPYRAEIAAASGAAVLALFGGLVLSLAVSAGMILTYYGISHLCAMRVERRSGLGGALVASTPYAGLVGCVLLVGGLLFVG